MRAIIAERMVESVAISPACLHRLQSGHDDALCASASGSKSRFEQKHGVKLTFMPFIAAAAVEALRRFPL